MAGGKGSIVIAPEDKFVIPIPYKTPFPGRLRSLTNIPASNGSSNSGVGRGDSSGVGLDSDGAGAEVDNGSSASPVMN